jgi:hypothetical protein
LILQLSFPKIEAAKLETAYHSSHDLLIFFKEIEVMMHQSNSSRTPSSTSKAWRNEVLRTEVFEAILNDLERKVVDGSWLIYR